MSELLCDDCGQSEWVDTWTQCTACGEAEAKAEYAAHQIMVRAPHLVSVDAGRCFGTPTLRGTRLGLVLVVWRTRHGDLVSEYDVDNSTASALRVLVEMADCEWDEAMERLRKAWDA